MGGGPNSAEWLSAGAEVVGALAGAGAAFLAWRAARASRDTAREVRAAHAEAVRPELIVSSAGASGIDTNGYWAPVVVLRNEGGVEAVDVEVEVRFADGTIGHGAIASVRTAAQTGGENWLPVDVAPSPRIVATQDPSNLDDIHAAYRQVILRFSDAGKVARWERTFVVERRPGQIPSDSPYFAVSQVGQRILGP